MKIQKTLIAAVTLALASAAYAGGDKNKSMTSAQGSSETATQQQASSDSTLQSSTSASPSATTANGQSGSLDTQAAASSGQTSANGQFSAQAGDESVRQLQQQLKDKGFDPGRIDGIDGPKTQAALRKSQEAGGMNASSSTDASTSSQSSTTSSQPSTTSSQTSTESNSTAQPK